MVPTSLIRVRAALACRIVNLDRVKFNEAVASGAYPCAPGTVSGRARLFDLDDLLALKLFSDLLKEGYGAAPAGRIACEVAAAARENPEAQAISYIRSNMVRSGWSVDRRAIPADQVPAPSTWNKELFHDQLIEKATTFNVWQLRQRIAQKMEEERSILGEED